MRFMRRYDRRERAEIDGGNDTDLAVGVRVNWIVTARVGLDYVFGDVYICTSP